MADDVKIIRIVIDSSKAIDGSTAATRALEAIEKGGQQVAASLQKMEDALDAGALYAKLIAVAGGGKLVVDKLLEMFKTARDAAAAITDLSEQLGVSTSFIQASQFSAAQHTVSLEKMAQGYTKATQIIGQAAQGQKAAIEVLDHLGVKALDSAGKLRSTESILQESAAAILKVEDPAKRVALAVELFGKSGAQLIPMLADIASGASNMAVKAQAAGAMIETGVLDQMAKLKSQSEEAGLKWNALVATLAAPIATDALERFSSFLGQVISQLERGRASGQGFWATVLQDSREQGRIGSGPNALRLATPEQMAAYRRQQQEADLRNPNNADPFRQGLILEEIAKADRQKALDRQASNASEEDWARRIKLPVVDGGGAGSKNPPVVGGGGGGTSPAQKYDELIAKLNIARDAQNQMTAASRSGDVAFQEQQATLDAQNKLFEIYGKKLDETDPKLRAVRDRLLEIAQGKAAEAFSVATTELQKQNVLLEAQIRLIGEAPEIQARELAIIKAKQEAQKAGAALSDEDIEKRRQAIEINERLKIQQDELKKSQELWTAPLKSALENIQRIGADAFDKFLENGKFSFDELQKVFTTTIRRMAAEFLALATIRPVMSVLVNAISPAMASSMGLGGSSGGAGMLGGGGGLGGGLSLPSGGGGSFLGNIGGFLSSPIMPQSIDAQIANWSTYGTSAQNSLGGGFLANTSWMQGLGALAGAGMGIYQLMSGNGSTSSTIGGISSIVGAGVSLIPGIGQIAGPAIALLGNLLPGLLGLDKPPTITNQEYGDVTYGANGFFTSGGAWGPSANARNLQGPLGQVGASMQGILGALGGVKDPSKVWGIALQSFAQQSGNNNFSNQTSFLAGPNGERIQWGQGSTAQDIGMEAAGVAATLKSIMEGAVGQISENLKKGLATVNTDGHGTFAQLATVVAEIKSFDDAVAGLGKTITSAEDAIKKIDDSFAAMYATADKYGLTTSDVDAAKAKARLDYSTDFGKSISRQILEITDPKAAALQDLDSWRTTMVDNNKWLLENVTGTLDQINEIEKLYGLKRAQIAEQSAQQSLNSLVDVIKRLTYGDLSGATPENVLSGTRGTYSAMLAKARAGDQGAIASLGGAAADYASAAKDFYAISPQYNAITAGLRGDLAAVAANNGGAELLAGLPQAIGILGQVLADLTMNMKAANEDNAALKAQIAELTALFQRVANG